MGLRKCERKRPPARLVGALLAAEVADEGRSAVVEVPATARGGGVDELGRHASSSAHAAAPTPAPAAPEVDEGGRRGAEGGAAGGGHAGPNEPGRQGPYGRRRVRAPLLRQSAQDGARGAVRGGCWHTLLFSWGHVDAAACGVGLHDRAGDRPFKAGTAAASGTKVQPPDRCSVRRTGVPFSPERLRYVPSATTQEDGNVGQRLRVMEVIGLEAESWGMPPRTPW